MSDWQPIETAPNGSAPVLLARAGEWSGEGWFDSERNEWYEAGSHWTDVHDGQIYPTHWMPLPDPPTTDVPPEADDEHPRTPGEKWMSHRDLDDRPAAPGTFVVFDYWGESSYLVRFTDGMWGNPYQTEADYCSEDHSPCDWSHVTQSTQNGLWRPMTDSERAAGAPDVSVDFQMRREHTSPALPPKTNPPA